MPHKTVRLSKGINKIFYIQALPNNFENEPLHVVAALQGQKRFIMTVYRPSLEEFESDYKTRKNRKIVLCARVL